MSAKARRQQLITRFIEQHEVGNQAQLIEMLSSEHVSATQATVSRDLDDLGAIKVRTSSGSSVYALPEFAPDRVAPLEQLRRVMGEWVGEVTSSSNLVVCVPHQAVLMSSPRPLTAVRFMVSSAQSQETTPLFALPLKTQLGNDSLRIFANSQELMEE